MILPIDKIQSDIQSEILPYSLSEKAKVTSLSRKISQITFPLHSAWLFLNSIPRSLRSLGYKISYFLFQSLPKTRLDFLLRDIRDEIVSRLDIQDIINLTPGCGVIYESAWSVRVWNEIAKDIACPPHNHKGPVHIRNHVLNYIGRVVQHAKSIAQVEKNEQLTELLQKSKSSLPCVNDCNQIQKILLDIEFHWIFFKQPPLEVLSLLDAPLSTETVSTLGEWRLLRDLFVVWNTMANGIATVPSINYHDTLDLLKAKAEGFWPWVSKYSTQILRLVLGRMFIISMPDVSQLTNVRYLHLDENPLRTLPNSIEQLSHLEQLWIFDTHIVYEELPASIRYSNNCEIYFGKIIAPALSFYQSCHPLVT